MDDVSVVVKTYDFARWLIPHLAKFSRDHRFTLGNRLEDGILDVLECLVEATYLREKRDLLRRANARLHRVRYLVRLATDFHLLSLKQYEFAATAIDEIGLELGGWLKQQERARGPREAPSESV